MANSAVTTLWVAIWEHKQRKSGSFAGVNHPSGMALTILRRISASSGDCWFWNRGLWLDDA